MAFEKIVVEVVGDVAKSKHTTSSYKDGPSIETWFEQDYSTWSRDDLIKAAHKASEVIHIGQTYLRSLDIDEFKKLDGKTLDVSTLRGQHRVKVRELTDEELHEKVMAMSDEKKQQLIAELLKK